MRPDFIPVGAVVNAHGIRGEVKVNPTGFDPEFIASFKTLYIGGQPVKVISARVHKSTVLLALPGVATMDDALALKGKTVSIRRTDAKLPKGQYCVRTSIWRASSAAIRPWTTTSNWSKNWASWTRCSTIPPTRSTRSVAVPTST